MKQLPKHNTTPVANPQNYNRPLNEEDALHYILTRRLIVWYTFYLAQLGVPILIIPIFFIGAPDPSPFTKTSVAGIEIDAQAKATLFSYLSILKTSFQVGLIAAAIKFLMKAWNVIRCFEDRVSQNMRFKEHEIDPEFFRGAAEATRQRPINFSNINNRLVDYAEDASKPIEGRIEAIRISGAYMSAYQLDMFDGDMQMACLTEAIYRTLPKRP